MVKSESGLMSSIEVADKTAGGEYEENTTTAPRVPRVLYNFNEKPDLGDIQPLALMVAQGMSKSVKAKLASVGQLTVSNFPAMDSMELVPLAAGKFREYRPDKAAAPRCSAPTGKIGEGDPGGVCEECPMSQWGAQDPRTGRSRKPPCDEGINVSFYSDHHKCLLSFDFKGVAQREGAAIMQRAVFAGWTNFGIRISTTETSNPLGAWFVPRIEFLMELDPEVQRKARMAYEALRSSPLNAAGPDAGAAIAAEVDEHEYDGAAPTGG